MYQDNRLASLPPLANTNICSILPSRSLPDALPLPAHRERAGVRVSERVRVRVSQRAGVRLATGHRQAGT
jgi:hypothetical protein